MHPPISIETSPLIIVYNMLLQRWREAQFWMPHLTWAKSNSNLDQPKLLIPAELIQALNLIQSKLIHWSILWLKKIADL